jgi:HEAT repeat protein
MTRRLSVLRDLAVWALRYIGASDQSIISYLIPRLKDSDLNVRSHTIDPLGRMRSSAKSTIPYLIPLLQNSDSFTRSHTAIALGNITESEQSIASYIIPLLRGCLKSFICDNRRLSIPLNPP